MKILKNKLTEILQRESPGFMMHTVAGYPDMESSRLIADTIMNAGADILEVQIPFSDPVADGPVIAQANEAALRAGATIRDSLTMIGKLTHNAEKPVVIMTYFNIIHRYGIEAFCRDVRKMGVQGLIIPDYPSDEDPGNGLIANCEKQDLAFIQVVASTTKDGRLKQIVSQASGFIYATARTGITGEKTIINPETLTYLKNIRSHSDLPLAVGFGLSEKTQVKALQSHADIMIVGSALIKTYMNMPLEQGLDAIQVFIHELISS